LPPERTGAPGIYRRGSKYVVVYRVEGRQRKQSAATLAEARAIKLQRDGEARTRRRGPTLHEFSLTWLDRYAGTGRDSVRANTRIEYRRLLVNFALTYFDHEIRLRDLDRAAVQRFVDWLTTRPGRDGRLCDRSIANALTPLRGALDAAVAEGFLTQTRPTGSCSRVAALAARGRYASVAISLALSWCSCSTRCRSNGGPCSSCWPPRDCGSPRPRGCAGATSISTARRRICTSDGQSSRARSSRRSHATAHD
jgi:hypothetical protein